MKAQPKQGGMYMIYKLYNYLKDVYVTQDEAVIELTHDNHRYTSDELVVNTYESKHNQMMFQLRNEQDKPSTVTIRFYNPIENIKHFVNLDNESIAYDGENVFNDIALVCSDWGTYIIKGSTPCTIRVNMIEIYVTYELEAHQDLETTFEFDKYVPIHTTQSVLEKIAKN